MAKTSRGELKQQQRKAQENFRAELAKSENRPDPTTTQEAYEKTQPVAQVKTEVIHEEVITETLAENPSQFEENKKRNFRYPLSMPASGKGYPGTITFEAHIVEGVLPKKCLAYIIDLLERRKWLKMKARQMKKTNSPL